MGVVTALRAGRRGRISVFVDGVYVCGVSEALLARRRLYQGLELDDADVEALRRDASAERIVGDAHRLLAQRQRSREELRRRLLQKEHPRRPSRRRSCASRATAFSTTAPSPRPSSPTSAASAGWGAERIRRGLAELGVAPDDHRRWLSASPTRTRSSSVPLQSCAVAVLRDRRSRRPGAGPTPPCSGVASPAPSATSRSSAGASPQVRPEVVPRATCLQIDRETSEPLESTCTRSACACALKPSLVQSDTRRQDHAASLTATTQGSTVRVLGGLFTTRPS